MVFFMQTMEEWHHLYDIFILIAQTWLCCKGPRDVGYLRWGIYSMSTHISMVFPGITPTGTGHQPKLGLNWHWLFCSWSKFGIYMAGSWNGDQQTWRFGRQSGKRRKDRGCDMWTPQEPQPQPGATGRRSWMTPRPRTKCPCAPRSMGPLPRARGRWAPCSSQLGGDPKGLRQLRGSKAEASSTSNSSWCFWRCVYCKCSTFRFPPMLWHGMIEVYEWAVFS